MNRFLVSVVVIAFVGCAGVQLKQDALTDATALRFNGYGAGALDCWECHNGDGKGTFRGPSLFSRIPRLTDAKLSEALRQGPGLMPAYQDKLTHEALSALVSWLQSHFGSATTP